MQAFEMLKRCAAERGSNIALVRGSVIVTWSALALRVRRLAHGLRNHGVSPGERIAILVPPSAELVVIAYAALAVGAVPVFLDPGLGLRRMLVLLEKCGAQVLVGTPLAQVAVLGRSPPGLRLRICTKSWPGCSSLAALAGNDAALPEAAVNSDDPGIVLFTSGATGAAKAISISRGTLDAQATCLAHLAEIETDSVLLTVLPAMLLLGPAFGCTVRIPRRWRLLADLADSTHSFGSPAVWEPVITEIERRRTRLPGLRRLLFGGCAIEPQLIRRWKTAVPQARFASVYGSTEAVPLAWAWDDALLNQSGVGTLIGRAGPGAELSVTALPNCPALTTLRARGPVVAGADWIDLGDVVRQDESGDWWFLGRASECITIAPGEVWTTAMIEPNFSHDGLRRIAAVGIGEAPHQAVVLVLEPRRWPWTRAARAALIAATLERAPQLAVRLNLTPARVLMRRRLPVDVRHRAKILRGELAAWAADRLNGTTDLNGTTE